MAQAAYTREFNGKHWIFIRTPAGDVVRLHLSYDSKVMAEQAIAIYGYRLLSNTELPSNDTAA
jgi:hypothetical protein